MNQFAWPVRIYYEDTDGGGVVYHSNYLKFMERARTEWLRSMGFEQTELREKMRVLFVVRGVKLKYRQPARFDDSLSVITRITRIGYSLLEFEQTIYRGEELLTSGIVEVVCVDADNFKPVSIPTEIRTATQMMEPQ
jgi:acyl-CoA thioester hydrolase